MKEGMQLCGFIPTTAFVVDFREVSGERVLSHEICGLHRLLSGDCLNVAKVPHHNDE